MICALCARAADEQLDESEHCDDPGGPSAPCTCQHRTGRYGTAFRVATATEQDRGGRHRLEVSRP